MSDRLRRQLDARALVTGAAVGVVSLAVVGLVVARLDPAVDETDSSASLLGVLLLVAAVGLGGAGWVAARRTRRAPLAHGAGAALVAMVIVTLAAVVRQAAGEDAIDWWPIVTWQLIALACGTVGALTVLRAPGRRRGADSPG